MDFILKYIPFALYFPISLFPHFPISLFPYFLISLYTYLPIPVSGRTPRPVRHAIVMVTGKAERIGPDNTIEKSLGLGDQA
jgi:hypothetical protein